MLFVWFDTRVAILLSILSILLFGLGAGTGFEDVVIKELGVFVTTGLGEVIKELGVVIMGLGEIVVVIGFDVVVIEGTGVVVKGAGVVVETDGEGAR